MKKEMKTTNWWIRDIYTKMISKFEKMLGEKSEYNVVITEDFLKTLKKRLFQLQKNRLITYNGVL